MEEVPFLADAHVKLRMTECLIRARKYDEALKAAKDFSDRNGGGKPRPLNRGAFMNQYMASVKSGNYEEAAHVFEDYCARNSAAALEAQTYLVRAQAMEKEKLYDAALTDVEFAEKVEPKSNFIPEVVREQVQCLKALGRLTDAAKRMEVLIRTYPNSIYSTNMEAPPTPVAPPPTSPPAAPPKKK